MKLNKKATTSVLAKMEKHGISQIASIYGGYQEDEYFFSGPGDTYSYQFSSGTYDCCDRSSGCSGADIWATTQQYDSNS
jgi:hypothetical protein